MPEETRREKTERRSETSAAEDRVLRKCVLSFLAGALFVGCISATFDVARYQMREGKLPTLEAFVLGRPVDRADMGKAQEDAPKDVADDKTQPPMPDAVSHASAPSETDASKDIVCPAEKQAKQDQAFEAVKQDLVRTLAICGLKGVVGVRMVVHKNGEVRVEDVSGEALAKTDVACVRQYAREQKFPIDAICAEHVLLDWNLDLSGKQAQAHAVENKERGTSAVSQTSKPSENDDSARKAEEKQVPKTAQKRSDNAEDMPEKPSVPVSGVTKTIVFVDGPKQEILVPQPSQNSGDASVERHKFAVDDDSPKANREEIVGMVKSMMSTRLMLAEIECQAEGSLKGTAVLRSDGHLKNIRATSGTLLGTSEAACIVGKLEGLSGSAFSGAQEMIPWTYPAE